MFQVGCFEFVTPYPPGFTTHTTTTFLHQNLNTFLKKRKPLIYRLSLQNIY
jgi:hypothetical protein